MKKEEFLRLVERYLKNESTKQEEDILINFIESYQKSDEWDEELLGPKQLVEEKLLSRLEKTIQQSNRQTKPFQRGVFFRKHWMAIAASLLIILGIGRYVYSSRSIQGDNKMALAKASLLTPGKDQATLTLSNGSTIPLDSSKNGAVFDSIVCSLPLSNTIRYKRRKHRKHHKLPRDPLALNTLSTPKGGQYKIILPDGTKVWLNSESSLTFPNVFECAQRTVKLRGEAYFEVAKNKEKPFIVSTAKTSTEVLGTHFNVQAYPDDINTITTLIEGAVKVRSPKDFLLLSPGNLAKYNTTQDHLTTEEADIESILAWKNGYFIFNNENIKGIMAKLARWYDAELEFKGDLSKKNFSAKISRRSDISEILDLLELTDVIHFNIQERRITIMP